MKFKVLTKGGSTFWDADDDKEPGRQEEPADFLLKQEEADVAGGGVPMPPLEPLKQFEPAAAASSYSFGQAGSMLGGGAMAFSGASLQFQPMSVGAAGSNAALGGISFPSAGARGWHPEDAYPTYVANNGFAAEAAQDSLGGASGPFFGGGSGSLDRQQHNGWMSTRTAASHQFGGGPNSAFVDIRAHPSLPQAHAALPNHPTLLKTSPQDCRRPFDNGRPHQSSNSATATATCDRGTQSASPASEEDAGPAGGRSSGGGLRRNKLSALPAGAKKPESNAERCRQYRERVQISRMETMERNRKLKEEENELRIRRDIQLQEVEKLKKAVLEQWT